MAARAGLPAPQVQRLTRLVENAVGFDAERGDSVAVESMAFAAADAGDAQKSVLPFGLTLRQRAQPGRAADRSSRPAWWRCACGAPVVRRRPRASPSARAS